LGMFLRELSFGAADAVRDDDDRSGGAVVRATVFALLDNRWSAAKFCISPYPPSE